MIKGCHSFLLTKGQIAKEVRVLAVLITAYFSSMVVEQWLRAGSPGTAMPQNAGPDAADGQSGSSFEAVLHTLRKY